MMRSSRALRTGQAFEAAVAEIDRLLDVDPPALSGDADRLEMLSPLVEDYERRHNPIDDSNLTPRDLVDFVLSQQECAALSDSG